MKYTSRAVLLLIVVGFSFVSVFFFGEPLRDQAFDAVVSGILAWLIGWQVDKTRFFNQELDKKRSKLLESIKQLEDTNKELEGLFNNTHSFLFTNDLVNKKITVSKGIEALLGYNTEELTEHYDVWLEMFDNRDHRVLKDFYDELLTGEDSQCELRCVDKDGNTRWFAVNGNPIVDSMGNVVKIIGAASEISTRKQFEEELKRMAYYDFLTGLPNRQKLYDELEKSVECCELNNKQMAVLLLDLDGFKYVNDTLGHHIGDLLLKQTSERLVNSAREEDLVARLGGDEFVIIIKDIELEQAKEVAERIIMNFAAPFIVEGKQFSSTPSIGICMYPKDASDQSTILIRADLAMYEAKQQGKNNYRFYHEI